MKKALLSAVALIVSFSPAVCAQTQAEGPPSAAELAEISARGRLLGEYDAAAWHATDAAQPQNFEKGAAERYVARKIESGWVVVWGRFNEEKTKFLIVYEARQQAGSTTDYAVTKHEPPLEDADFYFHAAKANELGIAQLFQALKPTRAYNVSVLPAASGFWYVYAIPGQTDDGVLPYGGDVRYTISPDGTKIVETRQMHKTVLEERTDGHPAVSFHTHALSNVPEDSDVFYAAERNASEGDWVLTKKYVYTVGVDGAVVYQGKTDEFVKQLRDGKVDAFSGTYRLWALASAQRLLDGTGAPEPLEVFASWEGARCEGNTLQIRLSALVHNTSNERIVLFRNALEAAQGRFARTEADLLAQRNYEKALFFTDEKPNFSNNRQFIVLGPGMYYADDREYPAIGADLLKGKKAAQFLFITWPLLLDDQKEIQRARWANTASLFTEQLDTEPFPIDLDPQMVSRCQPK